MSMKKLRWGRSSKHYMGLFLGGRAKCTPTEGYTTFPRGAEVSS